MLFTVNSFYSPEPAVSQLPAVLLFERSSTWTSQDGQGLLVF